MVLPAGQDASVVLTFRMREEISQGAQRVEAGLQRVQTASTNTNKSLAQGSAALLTFGLGAVAGARAVASLGQQLGLLNEEQSESVQKWLNIAGSVAIVGGSLAQLIRLLANPSISRFLAGGLAAGLGSALVAGTGAGLAGEAAISSARGETPLIGRLIERTSIGRSAGEGITSAGRFAREGGLNVFIQAQAFMGNESQARDFAKQIGRTLQEESRIGGFRLGN